MVASLLLMFAYDEVQFQGSKELYLPTPIALSDFVSCLFGPNRKQKMATRMNSDTEIKEICEKGLVFFTHFVKVNNVPNSATLKKIFMRCAALFQPDQFPGVDILVPVKLPYDQMSFLLVQVKNRKRDRANAGLRNKATHSDAVKELGLSMNYIGIMMCLRSQHVDSNEGKFNIVIPKPRNLRGRAKPPDGTKVSYD